MSDDLLLRIANDKLERKNRDEKMYALHKEGLNFASLAQEFGMSKQNVANRIARWEVNLLREKSDCAFSKLSQRTAKLLRENGLNTMADIQRIDPQTLLKIKNFGSKSLNEVLQHFFP